MNRFFGPSKKFSRLLAAVVCVFAVLAAPLAPASAEVLGADVSIAYPAAGACLVAGTGYVIAWNATGNIDHFALYAAAEGSAGPSPSSVVARLISGKYYQWQVPQSSPASMTLWVQALDSAGNSLAVSAGRTVKIASGGCDSAANGTSGSAVSPDTTPPSVPGNFLVSYDQPHLQVVMTWNSSTDNMGVAGYKIYRNGSVLKTVSSPGASDSSGLTAQTTYTYSVAAFDSAGNVSQQSVPASVTVPVAAVTTPVSTDSSGAQTGGTPQLAITNVRAEEISTQGAKILWNTNTAADSSAYFGTKPGAYTQGVSLRCDGGGQVLSHCVSLSGLLPSTTYYFKVFSYDSKNPAVSSGENIFTTKADPLTLPYSDPAGLTQPVLAAPKNPSEAVASVFPAERRVVLSWRRNSSDEKEFRVWRKGPSTADWVLAGTAGPNVLNFSESGVPFGSYIYNVSACNNAGCSGYSNDVSVYMSAPPAAADPAKQLPPDDTAGTLAALPAAALGKLSVRVLDDKGKALPGFGLRVFSPASNKQYTGVSGTDGTFAFELPEGEYRAEVLASSESDFVFDASSSSVKAGEAVTLTFKAGTLNLYDSVSGKVLFSDGVPVDGAFVMAYNPGSRQTMKVPVDGAGNFSLKLPKGSWKAVVVKSAEGQETSQQYLGKAQEVKSSGSGQNLALNFTIPVPNGQAEIVAVDGAGKPLGGVGITLSGKPARESENSEAQYKKTGGSGSVSFTVPAGTYYVRGSVAPSSGLLNPDERQVKLAAGQGQKITLVFSKAETGMTVGGLAVLEDGSGVGGAEVWAWSEGGASYRTKSDERGNFTVPLTFKDGQIWRLGASKTVGGIPYKSAEIKINQGQQASAVRLVLLPSSKKPLARPAAVSKPVDQPVAAQTEDGASVVLPQKAAATTGSVQVEVKPTVEAPSQADARVVGSAYDITVSDNQGRQITQLSKEVEITLPYNDEDLRKLGITPDKLSPSYFDEQSGTWVKVKDFSIDGVNHVVILKVQHLTRFALVAPADTTPPALAQSIQLAVSGKQQVTVSWVDPKADFHHSVVYRSENPKDTGSLVNSLVTSGRFVDSGVQEGKTYYYSVKEVDAAGNESGLAASSGVKVAAGSAPSAPPPPTGQKPFNRYLKKGNRGSEVKRMQLQLQRLGFFPADTEATGYYGSVTAAAVKSFQESAGLRQSGIMDKDTRGEFNKYL